MKRTLFIVGIGMLVTFLCVSLIGCASTSATWKNDDMSSFKNGQNEKSIREKLGKPYKTFTDSNGNRVLQYSKPAEGREAINMMMCIGCFGFVCGPNSTYADKFKFYLKNDRVVKTEAEENMFNLF